MNLCLTSTASKDMGMESVIWLHGPQTDICRNRYHPAWMQYDDALNHVTAFIWCYCCLFFLKTHIGEPTSWQSLFCRS